MGRISGLLADVPDAVLIDLIDGHVEADVVRSGIFNVLHDGVIGIPADHVVALSVSVQA